MLQKRPTRQKKISEYGAQLQEKQKTKQAYGLREKQFRRYFAQAAKDRSLTGQNLLQALESRFDNVIFRAGLALTRPQARQLVSHRHFKLNGVRVNIPSLAIKPGDVIEPYDIKTITAQTEIPPAAWLDVNKKTLQVKVERVPGADELPLEFDTQKVVQFYSR